MCFRVNPDRSSILQPSTPLATKEFHVVVGNPGFCGAAVLKTTFRKPAHFPCPAAAAEVSELLAARNRKISYLKISINVYLYTWLANYVMFDDRIRRRRSRYRLNSRYDGTRQCATLGTSITLVLHKPTAAATRSCLAASSK